MELGPDSARRERRSSSKLKKRPAFSWPCAGRDRDSPQKSRRADRPVYLLQKDRAGGIDGLSRYGNDIFVVWDAEDAGTDLHLKISPPPWPGPYAFASRDKAVQAADFDAITEAILEIEKQSQMLNEVTKCTESIRASGEKILDRVRITRQIVNTAR